MTIESVKKISNIDLFIKITRRMENNEVKRELQRLFLVLSFTGILGIMVSILEYMVYSIYDKDLMFFIFDNITSEFLAIGSLFIFLSTFIVMVIFSFGKAGLIDWNKLYKTLSLTILIIFSFGIFAIFMFGRSSSKNVLIIWCFMIIVALLISTYIFRKRLGVPFLIKGLLILDSFAVLVSLFFLFLFTDYMSLVLFFFTLGCFLVLFSCVIVVITFRLPESYDFRHKSEIYDPEFQKDLSEEELAKYFEKKVTIVSNEIEKNLGIDQEEFYSYLSEIKTKYNKKKKLVFEI